MKKKKENPCPSPPFPLQENKKEKWEKKNHALFPLQKFKK
jgi:hypothetical protein